MPTMMLKMPTKSIEKTPRNPLHMGAESAKKRGLQIY